MSTSNLGEEGEKQSNNNLVGAIPWGGGERMKSFLLKLGRYQNGTLEINLRGP